MERAKQRLGIPPDQALDKKLINAAYRNAIRTIDRNKEPKTFEDLVLARKELLSSLTDEGAGPNSKGQKIGFHTENPVPEKSSCENADFETSESDKPQVSLVLQLFEKALETRDTADIDKFDAVCGAASIRDKTELAMVWTHHMNNNQWFYVDGLLNEQVFLIAPWALVDLMDREIGIGLCTGLNHHMNHAYEFGINQMKNDLLLCPGGASHFDQWKTTQLENYRKLSQLPKPELDGLG